MNFLREGFFLLYNEHDGGSVRGRGVMLGARDASVCGFASSLLLQLLFATAGHDGWRKLDMLGARSGRLRG
jgi:hypothetical protein